MPRKPSSSQEIVSKTEEFINSKDKEKESAKTLKKLLPQNLLSSGSTMINLAATNNAAGAFLKGRYYIIIGASGAGKTWLYHALCAESGLHKRFKNYRLIKDEPEKGSDFDIAYYFGKKTAERIEEAWPERRDENGNLIPDSRTVEEFYDNLENKLDEVEKAGEGLIYILDSMDCLTTSAFKEYNEKNKEARATDKEESGSYGDGKAKINSQRLRDIVNRLAASGSMLFIICQERDNLGSRVGGKTFSGGNALLFYACLQIWLKKVGAIDAQIKGKKRNLGTLTKCQILKNRLTGQQDKEIQISYYHNFGIDDIGDIIDFLIDEKRFVGGSKTTSKINAEDDFGVSMSKEDLIQWIQEDVEREKRLKSIAAEVWGEIQSEIAKKAKRVNRYE